MLIPIAAVDFDFASCARGPEVLAEKFRRARVLARWAGVPVGIVEVSVRNRRIFPEDVFQAVLRRHPHALPREAVRRALLQTGVPMRTDPTTVWARPETAAAKPPKITVAVCTRDRPADLTACVASLMQLDPPPFEIIVVDNAPSTPATARCAREWLPAVRYVCEPHPGLDHARNRAIAEARGDIIAFTDDDVIVDRDWVGALGRAFAADPTIALVTGLAEPFELETRAQLLFERYGGFGRGCRRTYSQAPRRGRMPWTLVGAGQLGAGANMAFRREVFERVGAFDPALDVGTPTLGGGDHDMFFRVLHAGLLCVYEPAAVVRHRHRRTMRELRRLLFCYGHATCCFFDREEINFPADRPALRRLRRWWWRRWALARWWRAVFRPGSLPVDLVLAEIRGFLAASRAYPGIRARIVADENARPDAPSFPVAASVAGGAGAVGVVAVETAEPLRALAAATAHEAVEILVQWNGRPLGTVRIANFGQPISAQRLADEISHSLWHRLLEPLAADASPAFVRFNAGFGAKLPALPGPESETPGRIVTVVVTTCDRPAELRRVLESLRELRRPPPLQIVVVDNRPATNSAAGVVGDFPGVELVIERRPGSSYARNAGVAAARGEFVAMVDDDMRVAPDWLDQLLAPFARADVMAVTGNTLPARLETRAERILELYGGFCRGFSARDFDREWFNRRRRRAVPTWQIGGSGNAAFRREIFFRRETGVFDATLGAGVPTGVGEDTKLFYDILHADFTISYEPGAVAWHYHRVTMRGLRQQLFAYSKGHVAYHLRTWMDHRDGRALVRIFLELPQSFLLRAWERLRGRYPYPWSLLLLEMAGTLAGPWSLWRARRQARRIERQMGGGGRDRGTAPLLALRKPSLLEGRP